MPLYGTLGMPLDTPTIRGLPLDVILLAWMEEMQHDILRLKEDITESFRSTLTGELDASEIGGRAFHKQMR